VNNQNLGVKNNFKMKKMAQRQGYFKNNLIEWLFTICNNILNIFLKRSLQGDNVNKNSKLSNKRRVFMV